MGLRDDIINDIDSRCMSLMKIHKSTRMREMISFVSNTCVNSVSYFFAKNEDHYSWHDLRKNPENLPSDMENVQICWQGGSNNWYDSMFWDADRKVFSINGKTEFEVIHPVIGDKRHTAYGEAIAWRYIEPFEEVE